MKSILVLHPIVTKERDRSLDKEILWFDPLYGDIKKFQGTKLKFSYVEESFVDIDGKKIPSDDATEEARSRYGVSKMKRLKAEPVSIAARERYKEVDTDAVEKWFVHHTNYNDTSAKIASRPKEGVVFDIDESVDDVDYFLYSLDRNRIKFRIQ